MKLKAPLFLLCLTSVGLSAAPPAQEILARTRMQVRQDLELEGRLRQEDLIVPFRLTQSGSTVRYSFTNPDEALQVKLGEKDSGMEEISKEGIEKISGPEFEQKVRGTAITYEDLSLRFLYWSNAQVVGDDYINTRRVWKIELQPPGRQSQYSRVLLWCDQQSGAFLRMQGFDWNGKAVKLFKVVSVQTIEGRTYLKQMSVEQLNPETGKTVSRTYLEIKK